MYGIMDATIIFCPEILGNNNVAAHGKAKKKTNQRINDCTCGAYGCKSFFANKITNDDGIDKIVKLLKQVSYKERDRKQYKLFPYDSFSHKRVPSLEYIHSAILLQ